MENRFEYLFRKHFSDVEAVNQIDILFGRRARTRLGSIRKVFPKSLVKRLSGKFETQIIINGHFKNFEIPEYIIDATIAHELCHYAHGFSSPLPQLSRYPHYGGIVTKEMKKRGFAEIIQKQKVWLKKNWVNYLKKK